MLKVTSNLVSNTLAAAALIVSLLALSLSSRQFNSDYAASAVVQPGALPAREIKLGNNQLDFEVQNTSKNNLEYYLRANTNMGFIDGPGNRPQLVPTGYESQTVSLSKSDLPKSSYAHKLSLNAGTVGPEMPLLATLSDPNFYLLVEIVDARNGKTLFSSVCYYHFNRDSQGFVLDQPVIDTSGESEKRQAGCRA